MEPRLRQKLDPSDVVQETLTVGESADRRLPCPPTRLRFVYGFAGTALEQLVDARRRHRAQKRSFEREVRISDVSSMAIAKAFAAS